MLFRAGSTCPGDYAIDAPNAVRQMGTVWEVVQRLDMRASLLPAALCGRLLLDH
jgi:hypothetical protein